MRTGRCRNIRRSEVRSDATEVLPKLAEKDVQVERLQNEKKCLLEERNELIAKVNKLELLGGKQVQLSHVIDGFLNKYHAHMLHTIRAVHLFCLITLRRAVKTTRHAFAHTHTCTQHAQSAHYHHSNMLLLAQRCFK